MATPKPYVPGLTGYINPIAYGDDYAYMYTPTPEARRAALLAMAETAHELCLACNAMGPPLAFQTQAYGDAANVLKAVLAQITGDEDGAEWVYNALLENGEDVAYNLKLHGQHTRSEAGVSREDAEKVLAILHAMYPGSKEDESFRLFDHTHEDMEPGRWLIIGEGVDDWPFELSNKHTEDRAGFPAHVYFEPRNHYSVALYPN